MPYKTENVQLYVEKKSKLKDDFRNFWKDLWRTIFTFNEVLMDCRYKFILYSLINKTKRADMTHFLNQN